MDTGEKHSRKNPVETANFLSLLFFGWMAPIFWKGSRRDLHLRDLYDPLRSDQSERLGNLLEREWKKELIKDNHAGKDGKKKQFSRPNLMWALIRMFWVPCTLQGLLVLFHSTVLRLLQPVLQGLIISYFDPGQKLTTWNQVVLYAGFLVVLILTGIFIFHHTTLRARQTGMCMNVACSSIIYRKILRLNQTAMNNKAAGQVANLISNDVARFDRVPLFFHYIWITPIQMVLIGCMMWQFVGVAALVGMGAMIMQAITIQGFLSRLSSKFRAKIAAKTDERVQLMSELVSGMQIVKMYSWEKHFELLVSKVRGLEMKLIAYTSYLKGFNIGMTVFSEKVSLFFTLITFVLMGNSLTSEITFVILGLFGALQRTSNSYFSTAITTVAEATVSLKRITEFLLLDEVESSEKVKSNGLPNGGPTITGQQIQDQVGIEMIDVTANWVCDQLPPTLCKISTKIRSQSLCALVGPVGSGKSSLLHLVLGELPVQIGKLSLFTDGDIQTEITCRDIRISYASQDPWLFPATIRDNILLGQPYDERRYQEVIRVCALLEDFEHLSQGDLSLVGEKGAALSGGQKSRVNLARAVYRDADLYLLDDPLSAVDPCVGRHLFKECIAGFLKDKTRILVTHQQQYLRQADTVVVLNRGTVECQGKYDEIVKKNSHILDSGALEKPDQVKNTEEDQKEKLDSKVAKNSEGLSEEISEEKIATGNISSKVYQDYFLAGGNMCSLALLMAVFIAAQIAISGTDYWVSYWSNQETLRAASPLKKSVANDTSYRNDTLSGFSKMHFTESQWFDENGLLHPNLGIYIYTACLIGCILLVTLRSMLFMRMCMNSSRKIHDLMFANLLRATMRFFNTNPSGRILNRFAKDVGEMDELLPRTMLRTFRIFTVMLGICILVTLANKWMILPIVGMCGFFHIIRIYYIKTLGDVKRLEGIAKSPVFTHASSTLNGLTTIRSRGAEVEKLLQEDFDRYQDAHTGAWYLSIAASTALGFMVDLILCLFITCVCFSFILMDVGDTLGGLVGMAISQSLVLTGVVQFGVRQSAELISHMTTVERILQYTNLPKEGPLTTDTPPSTSWPSKGDLVFKDVSMKYADHESPVLKNLNLTINSGWKIGIVGRTGAGKSSLISALFRLNGDEFQGEIALDGIDTKSIGLHELRSRISIIPQEPVLFSASLRHNLDPFEQFSDLELWDSLREVELGDVVPSLDFQVIGGGSNFSVGQRQLICLARAILRNNRILVLDEATANVDHGTDALIQKTIRRRFADCTLLTISHRLNTIMDSDRVLVMSDGCIVEFGHPHLLLKNRDSHFSEMLQQTEATIAVKLAEVAANSFLLNSEFEKKSNPPSPPSPSLTEQITHL